jgi:hypothetical protein
MSAHFGERENLEMSSSSAAAQRVNIVEEKLKKPQLDLVS